MVFKNDCIQLLLLLLLLSVVVIVVVSLVLCLSDRLQLKPTGLIWLFAAAVGVPIVSECPQTDAGGDNALVWLIMDDSGGKMMKPVGPLGTG